jgi:urease accessory protein
MTEPVAGESAGALVRLLQLASPMLPIGAYSYSQGLEWAVGAGTVRDAATAERWIGDLLDHVLPHGEGAATWRLLCCAQASDWSTWAHWNAWFRASRETAELSSETEQTGSSLLRLLDSLELIDAEVRRALPTSMPITLPAAFSLAARGLGLGSDAALTAYLWAWLENQVLCAMKLVPLGQVAGQRLLLRLGERIPHIVMEAKCTPDGDMTSFAPGLALASSRHETQYTRLFRS